MTENNLQIMTENNFRMMGYRPMNDSKTVWGKPICGMLILAEKGDEDSWKFSLNFDSANGEKHLVWTSFVADPQPTVENIAYAECFVMTNFSPWRGSWSNCNQEKTFAFMNKEDKQVFLEELAGL